MSTEELLEVLEQREQDLGIIMFELRVHLRHSSDMRAAVNDSRVARIKTLIASLSPVDISTWVG